MSSAMTISLVFIFFVAYLKLFVITEEVIPERAEVYYFNKKYLSNATAYIRRTGRRSPYYINVEGTSVVWMGHNVSIHGVFYEYLHNEYKRSFVELDMTLCDLVHKEPWRSLLGETLEARGLNICPAPPGTYRFHNMTISMKNFHYVWPFEKVMLQAYAMMMPSQEIVARARFYVIFKHAVRKA